MTSTYHSRIQQKLQDAFAPRLLEIKDDSARHAGHAGHDPRGETHFIVKIISKKFHGLSRVQSHRLVYEALAEELKERVHAIVLEVRAGDE